MFEESEAFEESEVFEGSVLEEGFEMAGMVEGLGSFGGVEREYRVQAHL